MFVRNTFSIAKQKVVAFSLFFSAVACSIADALLVFILCFAVLPLFRFLCVRQSVLHIAHYL